MDMKNTQTSLLLQQWHGGDEKALDSLLDRHLPWLRNHVRKRLGALLRRKGETNDYVQDAIVQFLKYGPRVVISDENHFRALLVRIVENSLRNNYDWFTALRRQAAREHPLSRDSVLYLDPPRDGVKTPSHSAKNHEQEAWVRFAMELLESEDREVLVLRQWEKMSFADIGKQVGISSEAAWMRHKRALNRLADKAWGLRQGKVAEILEESLS